MLKHVLNLTHILLLYYRSVACRHAFDGVDMPTSQIQQSLTAPSKFNIHTKLREERVGVTCGLCDSLLNMNIKQSEKGSPFMFFWVGCDDYTCVKRKLMMEY
jgi:hypothetical protein